jgi:glyoxylase-like metal-dependent hydrolase (beta-lactamase superfamily II)
MKLIISQFFIISLLSPGSSDARADGSEMPPRTTQAEEKVTTLELSELSFPNRVVANRISERVLVLKLADVTFPNQVTAIASEKGLVVIDTLSSHRLASRYKAIIEEEFGRKDFVYVINTHSHQDHTGNNQVFEEAEIIAHEECLDSLRRRKENLQSFLEGGEVWTRNRIEELKSQLSDKDQDSDEALRIRASIGQFERVIDSYNNGFSLTLPTITFLDRMTLDLGDMTVKLVYFGRLHSIDNIIVLVPEEELVVVGDIFNTTHLNVGAGLTDRLDVQKWLDTLSFVFEPQNRVKHVICGHTANMTRDELIQRRDYIEELWNGVVSARTEGLSLSDTLDLLSMDKRFSYLLEWSLVLDDAALERRHLDTVRAYWRQLDDKSIL